MNTPLRVVMSGTGMAVPSEVLTNDYFASRLETSDEWITTRTGIKQRYRIQNGETTVSIAKEASIKALDAAGISASDIEMIVCATVTGDTPVPATACWLQKELGIKDIPAYDVNAACAGLAYALVQAAVFVHAGLYRNVLVVGAESLSTITNYEDRTTCVLFGDAASAVVLTRCDDPDRGVLYHKLGADGNCAEFIWTPAGGSRLPASNMTLAENLHCLRMKGREVYKFAVVKFYNLIQESLVATGLTIEDVDLIIPHQSNLRMIESVAQRLGVPMDKFVVNIDKYGNTSSASVGLALDEAMRGGRIKQGDLVVMAAFGAGLTWGILLFRM